MILLWPVSNQIETGHSGTMCLKKKKKNQIATTQNQNNIEKACTKNNRSPIKKSSDFQHFKEEFRNF